MSAPGDFVSLLLSTEFLNTGLRVAAPYVAASVGEIVSERAGIVNIGLEGLMLTGAFVGTLGSYYSGNMWFGVLAAVVVTGLIAAGQAFLMITLAADQVVSGIGLNLGALGLTTFLSRTIFGQQPPQISYFAQPWPIPVLSDIPVIGPIFFNHLPIVYVAYILVPLVYLLLFRTRWGLSARATGEQPRAADSVGIPVNRVRYTATILCGLMAGLAGTYFTLGNLGTFTENITAGNGFIALAVVIAAKWYPGRALAMSLLFGIARALVVWVPSMGIEVPYTLLNTLPYLATLIVYMGVAGRTHVPAALGVPYQKD
jgi:simple sugar transport system permease protein